MRPGVALLLALGATTVLAWGAHELEAAAAADPVSAQEPAAAAAPVPPASTESAADRFTRVDPGQVRVDGGADWSDPRWDVELAQVLADVAPFDVEDAAAHELVRARVAELSFVQSVGAVEVVWPDGLRVPVVLRRPIACVASRSASSVDAGYWLVADDGMILSGRWPTPPRIGGRYLPVLLGKEGEVAGARPGLVIASALLRDGLEIARQLPERLQQVQLDVLGPIAIDARHAADNGPDQPGIQLLLENQRLIAFGRSPLCDEPGELPVERKWWSIGRGLDALGSADERYDWELLDVRWDVPAWRLRNAPARGEKTDTSGARRGG
ncbi:MAG: hypothetical protein EPO68_16250 [Planctomycetota bacterium]|nr:MAG: hypothetical protein EPO68_16250 [Planctomycetota bacterium]